MGWFEEQIKQRIQNDNEAFYESFEEMARVIMKESVLSERTENQVRQAKTAVEEVLRYFGIRLQETEVKLNSLEEQVEYHLRTHGIMQRRITLRDQWYKDGFGVILGTKVDGSYVVLINKGRGNYHYLDHKTGKYVSVNAKNEHEISREALCFYRPLPLKKLRLMDLILFMKSVISRNDTLSITVMTLFITLLGVLTPKMNNLIFSHIIVSDNVRALFAAIIFLMGITISSTLLTVLKSLYISRAQTKMSLAINAAVMMRVLSLPLEFFKKYSAGNISSRIQAINTLCTIVSDVFFSSVLTSLFSLIYIGQIFKYTPSLAMPAILIVALTIGITIISAVLQSKISCKNMQEKAKEQGMIFSMFSGISKIKLAGAEKRFFSRWARQYVKSAKLMYSPHAFVKYNTVLITAITIFGTIIMYIISIREQISVANYMAFNSAYAMTSGAFAILSNVALTGASIKPILELAEPILKEVPEIAENKKMVDRLYGGVEISHVSFRYSKTMPMVIDDLSLKIRPGQYVAIVGGTGCGKSTLMRLMLGFEKPDKGSIYYDGKDISSLDLKSLRSKIGVVMQNGKLFQGDVFSNIVISSPNLTLDDAWDAAKKAGMEDDIKNMPMGMHSLISEGSGGISGGQRQRLMIARAIASKPKILMLDEATSALDNITQKIVSDSLDSLKCTRIVIAHRLSTIRQCDRIIVLDKGKIIEDGTYDELIEQNGFFAELVSRQQVN